MSSAKELLPPQARARSLDRLDAEIARAETARTRWLAKAHALEAGGLDSGYCRGLLGIAGERSSSSAARERCSCGARRARSG